MPTYEFRCPNSHDFQRFYKTISSGVSELPCPECGAIAVRQLSVGGLVFKGSGFYLTDYGKNAHRGSEPGKKGESSQAEGSKSEGGKADGGKAESTKAEGAKSEGGKTEKGKSESVKTDSAPAKVEKKAESREPKAESGPKAPSPKPKSE